MRVLLDTNIIIGREANFIKNKDVGTLYRWLDKLGYTKCVHPQTIIEIKKHEDKRIVESFLNKLESYHLLKTVAPDTSEISYIRDKYDKNENDNIDTTILNELHSKRVDILITEDRKIHQKAKEINIDDKVYTIEKFLEVANIKFPDLVDYKILSVKKEFFGNIDLEDSFFDSFKEDYDGFDDWFKRKSDEIAYICQSDSGEIVAFLYLKIEDTKENYNDFVPIFRPSKRLKIGTFKVISNGYKLGERFLKIIFDNASINFVDEIYFTIFLNTSEQKRLCYLMSDWGFSKFGHRNSSSGQEEVWVRDYGYSYNNTDPRKTYPIVSNGNQKFIVPIYPQYHTELFPDSILNTESPRDFVENSPNRNAIEKVYISRSINRSQNCGDLIVFYRTQSGGSGYHTSVITTLGVVQEVVTNVQDEHDFVRLCRRSVFSEQELIRHWNYNPRSRPFIVNFLYVCSFPKRKNRKWLLENGFPNDAPRGFEQLTEEQFEIIRQGTGADIRLAVH